MAALVACSTAGAQGTIRGRIFDSLFTSRPLEGATVVIGGTDRSGRTDARGEYVIKDVPVGSWTATFFHPSLDSMMIGAPVRDAIVQSGVTLNLDLALPGPVSAYARLCGPVTDKDIGVVIGTLTSLPAGTPTRGIMAATEWNEFELVGQHWQRRRLRATAIPDSAGMFRLCAVPNNLVLEVVARNDSAEVAGPVAVTLNSRIVGRTDLAVAAPGATGQITGRATRGRDPVRDAEVRLIGANSGVRTDANGRFRLLRVAAGTRGVEVRAIGFAPVRTTVTVIPDVVTTVDAMLDEIARALPEAVVVGVRSRTDKTGFDARSRSGPGTYLSASDVERARPVYFHDLLRRGPLTVYPGRRGRMQFLMRGEGGRPCAPNYFLDGMRWGVGGGQSSQDDMDDFVLPTTIAGVEFYRSQAATPSEFANPFSGCGTIVIWTK